MARIDERPVEGLDDPRVEVYRSLRRVARLRKDRTFVVEGARLVGKMLESPVAIHSLLLQPRWLETFRPLLERRAEPTLPVYVTSKRALEGIVGFHVHQGAMAVCAAPVPPPLETVVERPGSSLLVALSGVAQADNVGGILRSLAGFGGDGALLDGATCDPFVRRAARVSMGAVFHLPVWRPVNLPGELPRLREQHGYRVVAADVHEPCVDLDRAELGDRVVVVLGAEGDGLPSAVRDACDTAVTIPMDPSWDCLNVGTAGAILLWEIARRRRRGD